MTASDDLYATWVGLDFRREGVYAGEWAVDEFGDSPTKMVVLEGTTGSAPANDRAEGFNEAIAGTAIETIDSQTGDFTRDGGKTVMEGFLQNYGVDGIDLVYAHNDDMALGAIEAIEAAGAVAGEDIKIVSIDAVHDGMQALVDGKINYIVECNPLLGELAAGLVKDVLAGNAVEKAYYVDDEVFTQDKAEEVLDHASTDRQGMILRSWTWQLDRGAGFTAGPPVGTRSRTERRRHNARQHCCPPDRRDARNHHQLPWCARPRQRGFLPPPR